MRIIKKFIKQGEGYLTIIPTEEEDYWYIYNLVSQGDLVRSSTYRKLQQQSTTGVIKNIKKRITLTLKIVSINYYAGEFLLLSLKGRNCKENEYLKMGQYHTFSLELEQQMTIIKKNWDAYHYKIIQDISDPTHDADVSAFIMDEGVAHWCFVKQSITLIKQKIEKHIPKKKSGAEQHNKAMQTFYQLCFEVLLKIDFSQIKCLIISSPGFIKDEFFQYIKEQLQKAEYIQFAKKQNVLQKTILAKSSTGYLNSLNEVLALPEIQKQLKDTKAVKEIKVLEEFYKAMSINPDSVCYGQKHVYKAFDENAIKVLLISDSLFRTKELEQRKKFNIFVKKAKDRGVETHIFSSLHSSGEKLNCLTGIAGILRYPMNLENEETDENEIIQENFRIHMDDRKQENDEKEEEEDSKQNISQISQEIAAFGFEESDNDHNEEMDEDNNDNEEQKKQ